MKGVKGTTSGENKGSTLAAEDNINSAEASGMPHPSSLHWHGFHARKSVCIDSFFHAYMKYLNAASGHRVASSALLQHALNNHVLFRRRMSQTSQCQIQRRIM